MSDPDTWINDLKEQGYCHLPGLVPPTATAPARAEIDRLLAEQAGRSGWISFSAKGHPSVLDLLRKPPVVDRVERILGWDRIDFDRGPQVAVSFANGATDETLPAHHFDGFNSPGEYYPCAMIVGVHLSATPRAFSGNYTVWPGSHHGIERYWRERDRTALTAGMPTINVGQPRQLVTGVGDVVISHFQLAHAVAPNTSDVDRVAVYFRIWMSVNHWAQATNLWHGWKI
jgi:hypothetical protein